MKRLSKKMKQALADLPIKSTPTDGVHDWGEVMVWCGEENGVDYKVNTLTALVKRDLIQFDRGGVCPHFKEKEDTSNNPILKKYYEKENKYWLDVYCNF